MNAVPKYAFSRRLEGADWNNTTLVKGDIAAIARQLPWRQPGTERRTITRRVP
jgi:hypothetical protein